MSNVNHNLLAAEAPRREAFTWIASKETVAAQLPSCADLSGYGWIIYSIYVYIYIIYIYHIYIYHIHYLIISKDINCTNDIKHILGLFLYSSSKGVSRCSLIATGLALLTHTVPWGCLSCKQWPIWHRKQPARVVGSAVVLCIHFFQAKQIATIWICIYIYICISIMYYIYTYVYNIT